MKGGDVQCATGAVNYVKMGGIQSVARSRAGVSPAIGSEWFDSTAEHSEGSGVNSVEVTTQRLLAVPFPSAACSLAETRQAWTSVGNG